MISQVFKKNKNNFYVLTGNFLEFFDLYMYIHLAHIIHKYYFVGVNESLLNVFTFANFYLLAPIGCIVFAYLGDTVGRKKVIVSTSIVMAFCSSLVGILPTYHDIGALAGVLLVILRVLQGISLSGEPTAANLYLVESTPYRYTPLFISMAAATECLGGAVALGVGYIAIDLWGESAWRVPFYLGVFFCFFSLWLRWNLSESKDYLEYTSEHKDLLSRQKKRTVLAFYRSLEFRHRNFFCWIGVFCAYGTAFSISYVYLGNFLTNKLGLTEHQLLLHNFKVALCEMVLALFWGFLVVRFNLNVKKFLIFRTLNFLCILPFIVNVLSSSPGITTIFIIQVMLVTFSEQSVIFASLLKVFPVIGRFSLMGIGWACAQFLIFFISGIVLNYISSFYGIAWMVAVMFMMSLIFLMSVIFYIPYDQLDVYSLKKQPQPPEEMAA